MYVKFHTIQMDNFCTVIRAQSHRQADKSIRQRLQIIRFYIVMNLPKAEYLIMDFGPHCIKALERIFIIYFIIFFFFITLLEEDKNTNCGNKILNLF